MKSLRAGLSEAGIAPAWQTGWAGISLATWGSLLCFFAAVGYTATNMCLRQLAILGTDPMWATAIKETVAVVVLGPWLLLQRGRGRRFFPSAAWIALVLGSGLVAQFAGNILQQWSFGVVGLAIAVPAIFSMSLTGSALLGWICLGETISFRTLGSLVVLIGAIVLLSVGAVQSSPAQSASPPEVAAMPPTDPSVAGQTWSANGETSQPPEAEASRQATGLPREGPPTTSWATEGIFPKVSMEMILLGIGAACVAGASFAQLGLMLRVVSSKGIASLPVVVLVTGVGAALLGPISLWRLGPSLLLQTTAQQWIYMGAAGICNLLAFLAITTGLRWTKLLRANLLNAAQVAMGALAGIVVFSESCNWAITAGVALTVIGLSLMGSPKKEAIPHLPPERHHCQKS